MSGYGWLVDLFVTLFGTFAGVGLAFWLDRLSREAEAVRHYANTLNSIRADLANLWAVTNQASEHLLHSGAPFDLFPPDTPAVDAALANSAFYDRAPFSLVNCLIVVSTLRRSLGSAFRDHLASRDNQRLKSQIDQLFRVVSHIQRVVDDEATPLGKPVIRTPHDVLVLDGLKKAMRGENAEPPSGTSGEKRGEP
jgi:hypothetical protein